MPTLKEKPKSKKRANTEASRADKHDLYLRSVQEPSVEVDFFKKRFKKYYKRAAKLLREDFCGTAAVCYDWVKNRPDCEAIGVDIDPDPLEWGQKHLATKLKDSDQQRVTLLEEDVRLIIDRKADILSAQNFSFWIFKTRNEVREYFETAFDNLGEQGLFIIDMMGGGEAQQEDRKEKSKKDGFTYVWEQARFDPITHDCKFHIHFHFKDGSKLKKAFTYEWRFWTIPEVTELLGEAGFKTVDVYWEGSDEDGDGDGIFKKSKHGTADPAWIAYIIAAK